MGGPREIMAGYHIQKNPGDKYVQHYLDDREQLVAKRLLEGLTHKVIKQRTGASEKTIKNVARKLRDQGKLP